mmetsp:Transcript_7274/g.17765  ORF Transcript_7274/g.17765 Transcript_7274/m.17765 type:complete len:113 (+) Transcript_7274:1678-2016(+)
MASRLAAGHARRKDLNVMRMRSFALWDSSGNPAMALFLPFVMYVTLPQPVKESTLLSTKAKPPKSGMFGKGQDISAQSASGPALKDPALPVKEKLQLKRFPGSSNLCWATLK